MELSAKHKVFANEIIRGRTPAEAYSTAYPKSNATTCRVNSYKILQNTTVAEYIRQETDKISQQATKEAINELKDKIVADYLEIHEKRTILADIARKKIVTKTYEPLYDEENEKWVTKPLTISEPTIDQIVKAIATDNLMVGANAPTKVANTTASGEDKEETIFVYNGKKLKL
jgi:hypothetical protein